MNLFALIDGELHTPKLTATFLEGVTRDSVIQLARHLGYRVHERSMPIDELLTDLAAGRCTEAFACGTAAIISPISVIADADDTRYELPQIDQTAATLRNTLLGIQERRIADPFGWIVELDARYL